MLKQANTSILNDRQRGMSLMEVVVSIVLLAVLMAALSGIVPRFHRETLRINEENARQTSWMEVVLARIQDDLVNAQLAVVQGSTLQLTGRFHRDPVTGNMTDTTGVIIYRLVTWSERTALVVQTQGRTGLLGAGDFQLAIEPLGNSGENPPPIILQADAADSSSKILPLSPRFKIALISPEGTVLCSQHVIRVPSIAITNAGPQETAQ